MAASRKPVTFDDIEREFIAAGGTPRVAELSTRWWYSLPTRPPETRHIDFKIAVGRNTAKAGIRKRLKRTDLRGVTVWIGGDG